MSDEKEDYKIDDQAQEARPSGFDLAKIVSDMLADPETFDSCQRLGEAVLNKPAEPKPKRRDPQVEKLIYLAGRFKQSAIIYGNFYGYSLVLVSSELMEDIFMIANGIQNEYAGELLKLSTLASFGGIKVMSYELYDRIGDRLALLI